MALERGRAWYVRGFFDHSTVYVRRDRYPDGSADGCVPITITQGGSTVTAWLTQREAVELVRALAEAVGEE